MSLRPLRFLFGATCPVSHTPVATMLPCPQNGDSGCYSSQMPIFCEKDSKGDHFDILTKGSLLSPPNGTKSKNHHGYFSGSFPLTISAKRNESVAEVYIPMARAG
jgi:hypothetical protein